MDMPVTRSATLASEYLGIQEAQIRKLEINADGNIVLLVDYGIGGIKRHYVNPADLPMVEAAPEPPTSAPEPPRPQPIPSKPPRKARR